MRKSIVAVIVLLMLLTTGYASNLPPWAEGNIEELMSEVGITEEQYEKYRSGRTLTIGDEGDDILIVKNHLFKLGYYNSKQTNNTYTKDTQTRIDRYRKAKGSSETGGFSPYEQVSLHAGVNLTFTDKVYKKLNYKQVARGADSVVGAQFKITGTVFQHIDAPNGIDASFLVYVDGNKSQVAYLFARNFKTWEYESGAKISQFLDGDKLIVYAISTGYYNYVSVDGASHNVPSFDIIFLRYRK